MITEDWLMRQIKGIIEMISKLLFGKETARYEIHAIDTTAQSDFLHVRLMQLLSERQINEAENELFDAVCPEDRAVLLVALDFYDRLAGLDDAALLAADFSREEIKAGLDEIMRVYGITGI